MNDRECTRMYSLVVGVMNLPRQVEMAASTHSGSQSSVAANERNCSAEKYCTR